MKFLVDAQLPRRIARSIAAAGYDAIHTLDLPQRNSTSDGEILGISAREERIVVTNDADFVASFHLNGRPHRLLLISTGNISNSDLERILLPLIPQIVAAFEMHRFLEVTRSALVIRV
jgi:predicted nuclease of predicted toxin-antitoxin system